MYPAARVARGTACGVSDSDLPPKVEDGFIGRCERPATNGERAGRSGVSL
jgi:hypothetical protein